MRCTSIDRICGAKIVFKCENLQKAGAFKYRGAMNTILQLTPRELNQGVATHSSGNHAQALARAAQMLGVTAHIVMPETAPKVKVEAVKSYGGRISFCKPTLEAREQTLQELIASTGASLIHPYNDHRIIAGQATACKELLSDHTDLECVVAPVGGGGLLSGTLLSAHHFGRQIAVFGAEPSGADDAMRSMDAGEIIPSIHPNTIADGLLTSLGSLTFPIIQKLVTRILTVDDKDIVYAMRLLWERAKILVEPSAATALAIVLVHPELFKGSNVGIILSGGNVDLDKLPW